MDRDVSTQALWALDHIQCPFCSLHCVMQCTKHLLQVLQARVVEQGGERGAERFNRAMKGLLVGFCIKKRTEDGMGGKWGSDAMWKHIKLSGNIAMCVVLRNCSGMDVQSSVGRGGSGSEWQPGEHLGVVGEGCVCHHCPASCS
jgi:hypothetical protein